MKYFLASTLIAATLFACKEKNAGPVRLDIPINQKINALIKEANAATDDNKKAALFGEASELLTDKGDYHQAMQIARLGERANPTQKQCLTSIAEVQLAEGKIAEAAITLKDVLQRHGEHGRAHFVQGNMLASKGDYAGALKSYATAEKAKFKDSRVLLNTGNVNLRAKKNADAAKAYARAVAEYPDLPEAYLGAGIASRQANLKPAAKKYFEKYLTLAPNASQADRVKLWLKAL